MLKISIPKPCHEDWQAMTPTNQGAFCKACAKEVIDFTQMNDDEVRDYFLNRASEKSCGRFNTHQLTRIQIQIPAAIFTRPIAGWKRFMAIVLIAFGTTLIGCDVTMDKPTQGKVVVDAKPVCTTTMGDTTAVILGMLLPRIDTAIGEPKTDTIAIITPDLPNIDGFTTGEIQMVPVDTVQAGAIVMAAGKAVDSAQTVLDSLKPTIKSPADSNACNSDNYW